jgi:pyruvate formate lyase activating enzyme
MADTLRIASSKCQFFGGLSLKILGLNKTTLLDYPEKVAATIFTGGCNFRCPFCHNRDLVLPNERGDSYSEQEILDFLSKRKNVLSGVCVSGGEPTINSDLPLFIEKIKAMGYMVKLDTNGTNPYMLKELIEAGLIDYCAMDIKNCPEKYNITCGVEIGMDISDVKKSVSILLNQSVINYEFRTTIVQELHTEDDIIKIAAWIKDAKAYFLQSYKDCDQVISHGFHAHDENTLRHFHKLCLISVPNTFLRGV